MSTGLAREDLGQIVLLILIGPFVHVEGNFPFAFQHVAE